MEAKSRPITFAGAAILLLAMAAGCSCADGDYYFSFGEQRPTTVWMRKPKCGNWEDSLLLDGEYSGNAQEMLKQLLDQKTSGLGRISYSAGRLIRYTWPDCDKNSYIVLEEFINLFTSCNGDEKFKNFANFVQVYAPPKIKRCAFEFVRDLYVRKYDFVDFGEYLSNLKMYFGKAFEMRFDERSDQEMYKRVKEVDLANEKFDVEAIFKGAGKFCESDQQFYMYKNDVCTNFPIQIARKVNLINVARGLGLINEDELTDRFLLVNEYLRLAVQMRERRDSMK